jgi:hypothetical protein
MICAGEFIVRGEMNVVRSLLCLSGVKLNRFFHMQPNNVAV